jgi:ketosteroid isomerase-like protein
VRFTSGSLEDEMPAQSTAEETEVRASVEELAQELRDKDLAALMRYYSPDTVTFEVRPPQQIRTADRYRQNFETWFASVEGRIGYELSDLSIRRRRRL